MWNVRARSIQSMSSYHISLISMLMLSFHLHLALLSGYFPSDSPTKFCISHFTHVCYIPCLPKPPWLDHTNIIRRRVHIVELVTVLSSFLSLIFWCPNILLSILLFNHFCAKFNLENKLSVLILYCVHIWKCVCSFSDWRNSKYL